ncbi:hypothetical protein GCM10007063_34990 [Lentibacillus kapialis]|uniref:Uncharacterized protein n=1 Tax=Lentibacillus kapialis TaxID=340214 RepID=A0A917V1I5_9BACI|nr:hypothetical protein [Lentibacillus kapialis]GGK09518.1 hypothetical protein GCM10007063_34990 [Lentibacillus kapialis]
MNDEETNTKPSEMDPEELPDVRAFQDEFTREFLQSTEETRDGYYPFLSGTGKYKMDFPAGGVIGEKGYALKKKKYEGYLIGVEQGNGLGLSIKINYYSQLGNKDMELDMLASQFDNKLNFEKVSLESSTLYIAAFEDSKDYYGYAAILENSKGDGIHVIFETECTEPEKCRGSKQAMQKEMEKWIRSITFINKNESRE